MAEITMPKLSDTMTEGKLIAWKKGVGEQVERGDIIAEVETDKATMELESYSAGILREIRVNAGQTVPVGTIIGIVGADAKAETPATVGTEEPPLPENWQPPVTEPPEAATIAGDVPERIADLAETAAVAHPETAGEEQHREKAAPLVRRIAREKGIDLHAVQGSGPEGRILLADLERYQAAQTFVQEGVAVPPMVGEETRPPVPEVEAASPSETLSPMRSAIARTVSRSWQTIPHFYLTAAIDMGEAETVRHELKAAGHAITINDMVLKACAMALSKFSRVNSSWGEAGTIVHPEINIGIAVGLEAGLLVPVIKGCAALTLIQIAAQSRTSIDKARTGTLSQGELGGGTFTISNLGMYGVEEFTAIILPPQAAILAVAAIVETAVVREGQLVTAKVMKATLSADHRVLDGLSAARFMAEVRRVLENPVTMLV